MSRGAANGAPRYLRVPKYLTTLRYLRAYLAVDGSLLDAVSGGARCSYNHQHNADGFLAEDQLHPFFSAYAPAHFKPYLASCSVFSATCSSLQRV